MWLRHRVFCPGHPEGTVQDQEHQLELDLDQNKMEGQTHIAELVDPATNHSNIGQHPEGEGVDGEERGEVRGGGGEVEEDVVELGGDVVGDAGEQVWLSRRLRDCGEP